MTAYGRGRHAEYLARNRLWRQGYIVFRTAGSHGEVDLIPVAPMSIRCVQVKSTRGRPRRRDLADRVEALRRFRTAGRPDAGADPAALRQAARAAEQVERLLPARGGRGHAHVEEEDLARLLLDAYPDGVARLREAGGERYLLAGGRGARLAAGSCERGRPLFVAVEVDAGPAGEGVIHAAAAVAERTVREEGGDRIVSERSVVWDPRERRVVALERERLGAVSLLERPFPPGDGEALPVLCEALRAEGAALLPLGGEARQIQGRVRLLAEVFPAEGWPDLAEERLFARPEEWLLPRLGGVRSARDLARVDVAEALRALVPQRLARRLEELAPTHVAVPSGSRAALDYAAERAAHMAGLQSVPVVVRDVPDSDAIVMSLIENIQRENLSPLEEAMAVRRLIDEFGLPTRRLPMPSAGRGWRCPTCCGSCSSAKQPASCWRSGPSKWAMRVPCWD